MWRGYLQRKFSTVSLLCSNYFFVYFFKSKKEPWIARCSITSNLTHGHPSYAFRTPLPNLGQTFCNRHVEK